MSTRTLSRLFWIGFIVLGLLSIAQAVIVTWFM